MNETYDPAKAASALGRSLASGAKAVAAAVPRMKTADTSAYPNAMNAMSSPSPATQGYAPWVSEQGANLRNYGSITTPYGGSTVNANNPGRGEAGHQGIDVAAGMGSNIPFLRGGIVTEVGTGHQQGEPNSFGNYVKVKDKDGNYWRYSHLSRSYVKVGQQVGTGQYGMQEGNTGNTFSTSGGTGSHLDLRITDAFGQYQDPRNYGIMY